MIREIENITVVDPCASKWVQSRTSSDMEKLHSFAQAWQRHFSDVAGEQGVNVRTKSFTFYDVDLVEELPTDLIVYFIDTLEDNGIIFDIHRIVTDGRVHLIQIITKEDLPTHLDSFEHFFRFSLRGRREGRLLIPDSDAPTGDQFIRADSIGTYSRSRQSLRRNVELLLSRLIHRIEASDEIVWD